jgi:cytochrome c553
MVAFLLQLPKLDPPGYQRLVNGGVRDIHEISSTLLQNCERCHGLEGKGTGTGETPKLAGQHEAYIIGSLRAFAQGKRHSGIMEPVALKLDEEDIRELAAHYSGRPSADSVATIETHAESFERGQEIARRGAPAQGIPACVTCHGPGAGPRNPAYPVLAGQYRDYLVLQLELFKDLRRGGSEYAHLMHHIAPRLNPSQMRDVAFYYSSLDASPHESAR